MNRRSLTTKTPRHKENDHGWTQMNADSRGPGNGDSTAASPTELLRGTAPIFKVTGLNSHLVKRLE